MDCVFLLQYNYIPQRTSAAGEPVSLFKNGFCPHPHSSHHQHWPHFWIFILVTFFFSPCVTARISQSYKWSGKMSCNLQVTVEWWEGNLWRLACFSSHLQQQEVTEDGVKSSLKRMPVAVIASSTTSARYVWHMLCRMHCAYGHESKESNTNTI